MIQPATGSKNAVSERHLLPAGEYMIDPARTSVEFVISNTIIHNVRGRFSELSGAITIQEHLRCSHVEVQLKATSIDTGIPKRDRHLQSQDFFDVKRFPTIGFRSSKVEPTDSGAARMTGDLTIRNVTHPVILRVALERGNTGRTKGTRIAFSAVTEVNREDWGISWNRVLIGRKAQIKIHVEAIRSLRPGMAS
jgi:polyisoprenoid-binding protein YceI